MNQHDKPALGVFRRGDWDAPNKLAIGVCTLGSVRIEHEIMMLSTGMPLGQAQAFMVAKGYGIQDARNIAWHAAEYQGWEYFMFWDDDVIPLTGATVETMLETMEQNPEIDILGGVYPARQSIPSPIVTLEAYGKPWWGWEVCLRCEHGFTQHVPDIQSKTLRCGECECQDYRGGVYPVWMTGTGFTMYRMESMKKLSPPSKAFKGRDGPYEIKEYFRLEDGTDDYILGRDAEAAGLTWYVHGGVICDQMELDGRRYEVRNARQRIGGTNGKANKGASPARDHADRPAPVHAGKRAAANVRHR